jgi:hypothetical protein
MLASAAECPQRIVQERNLMLDRFADLLSGSSPNYCPSQSDPFFLYDSATQFHWSFFTKQDAGQSSEACKALTGEAAELAELQESLLLAAELQQALIDTSEAIGVARQFDAWQYEVEAYWGDFTTETTDLTSFDARAAMSLPAAQTSSDDADASPSAQGDAGPSAAPWGNAPAYDSSVMSDLRKWIATKGENLVLFYGEYDPWSAWSIDLGEAKNSLMIRIPRGVHWSSPDEASAVDQLAARALLRSWLGTDYVHDDPTSSELDAGTPDTSSQKLDAGTAPRRRARLTTIERAMPTQAKQPQRAPWANWPAERVQQFLRYSAQASPQRTWRLRPLL